MFETHLHRWHLVPDGEPIVTHSSHLLPVKQHGLNLMLKLSDEEDERTSGLLMDWWDGNGAAQVLAHGDGAILMERATGPRSLTTMARSGEDDEACRILCAAAARLHAPRNKPLPALVPLQAWFQALEPIARTHGGILARCEAAAQALLSCPRDFVPLHGDLHHGNVLDFAHRGWLAIDPKRLVGERGFDYANIFTNPDLADPEPPIAVVSERFEARLAIVTEASGLDRERLLLWIAAWCGLSASWFLEDGEEPSISMQTAALAFAQLDR